MAKLDLLCGEEDVSLGHRGNVEWVRGADGLLGSWVIPSAKHELVNVNSISSGSYILFDGPISIDPLGYIVSGKDVNVSVESYAGAPVQVSVDVKDLQEKLDKVYADFIAYYKGKDGKQ